MFLVSKGTPCRVVKSNESWMNVQDHVTVKDNVFDKEQVIVDPVGKLGVSREFSQTIGGHYAKNGWYGFEENGWVILVHVSNVRYG